MWALLIAEILAFGPELFTEADTVFNNIATGKGGAQKVANTAGSLAVLANSVAKVAAMVQPPPPSQVAAQAANVAGTVATAGGAQVTR